MRALVAGLELLGPDFEFAVVAVMDAPDEWVLAGSGHYGPEMAPDEYDQLVSRATDQARSVIARVQDELALGDSEIHLLRGDPGQAICQLAREMSARAIVVGSRGRGRVKRALLGSVSDHIVRNAPCSVIVTRT
jgi:nucleotide-binding universal stress UspA family protein